MNRLLLIAAAAAAIAPLLPHGRSAPPPPVRWPTAFEGRALVPMAPAPEDAQLARGFPGRIARFTDGRRQIVLRSVASATRQLHPSRDCFQAIGYRVTPLPMQPVSSGFASCFAAERGATRLRVCEHVRDGAGTVFAEPSSWYWPALLGRSPGPWFAATVVERTD